MNLEEQIRKKAVEKFRTDVASTIVNVLNTYGVSQTVELHKAVIDFLNSQEKRVGDRAVRSFLSTYERLIQEFPHLTDPEA